MIALQNPLKDRFHLREHREMRDEPVHFLTVGKGSKMPAGSCVPVKKDLPNECCGVHSEGLVQTLDWQLAGALRRLVIDKTGLTGTFDVHLRWAKDPVAIEEQLGLRLDAGRGSGLAGTKWRAEAHPTQNHKIGGCMMGASIRRGQPGAAG